MDKKESMKDQFCNYEIALKLKELGFDEECFGYYKEGSLIDPDDVIYKRGIHNRIHQTYNSGTISVPLWQQVIDWVREKYDIHFHIDYSKQLNLYGIHFQNPTTKEKGYSEEEVLELLYAYNKNPYTPMFTKGLIKWFETNKKK